MHEAHAQNAKQYDSLAVGPRIRKLDKELYLKELFFHYRRSCQLASKYFLSHQVFSLIPQLSFFVVPDNFLCLAEFRILYQDYMEVM